MSDQRYLDPANQRIAGEFLNGLLWANMKQCLLARYPENADVKDDVHVAAAKGHVRAGYGKAIEELEKLPLESDETPAGAFERPAVTITED